MHCFGFTKQRGTDLFFLEIEETTLTATEYPSIHPRDFSKRDWCRRKLQLGVRPENRIKY